MNRLLLILLLVSLALVARAANPTLENFDQVHFRTNGPTALKMIQTRLGSTNFDTSGDTWVITNVLGADGASKWFVDTSLGTPGMLRPLTSLTYGFLYPSNFYNSGWFALQPTFQLLGSGTNTLDTKDSSWLLFSMTNDPTEVTISLSGGYAMGQELLMMSYTNTVFNGRFTLPADSVVSGGGLVKLNNDQDWLGENGSAIRLIWIEPDWWEQGRWFAGSTNQPGQVVINPTIPHYPYKSGAAAFSDGALIHIDADTIGVGSTTNALSRNGERLRYANSGASGSVFFEVKGSNANAARYGVNSNGDAALTVEAGKVLFFTPNGAASGSIVVQAAGILPDTDDQFDLGADASNGAFQDLYMKGVAYVQGLNDGIGNRSRLEIEHDNSNITFDSTALGTGTPRDFLWQSNGVTVAKIALDSGYDGSTTKYLDASGHYSVPAGGGPGGSDNWVASGATNSTLPGIGSANALIGTNGVYAGNGFYAPWWTASADDTFIGVHDVSQGDSDYSYFHVGNVDDGAAEVNYADLSATLTTTAASPAAIFNLAAVATNLVSTFTVNLQPDQGVARIDLVNGGDTTFNVEDDGTINSAAAIKGGSGVLTNGITAGASTFTGVVETRNGTTAMSNLVYGTYTDASNYRLGAVAVSTGGILDISSRGLGTGATGNTMRFLTDGTARWTINSSGHFLAGTDNTYDIGASGATRPRAIYVAGAGTFGGLVTANTLNVSAGTTTLNQVSIAAGNDYLWSSRSRISSPADGIVLLQDNAETDFNRLQFGGTTASFPALKRSTTNIVVRLADDSDNTGLTANTLNLSKTITAGGTTGDQVINKAMGSVNFAIAGQTITVTSDHCDANSIIMATVATDDTTAKSCIAVPGAGSFVLKLNAAATAETKVMFLIHN